MVVTLLVVLAALSLVGPMLLPRHDLKVAAALFPYLWAPYFLLTGPPSLLLWPCLAVLLCALVSSAGRISLYPRMHQGESILTLGAWIAVALVLSHATRVEVQTLLALVPCLALAAMIGQTWEWSSGAHSVGGLLVLALPIAFSLGPSWFLVQAALVACFIILGGRWPLLVSGVTAIWAITLAPIHNTIILYGGVLAGFAWFWDRVPLTMSRMTPDLLDEGVRDRVRMWGFAWRRFLRKPLLGWGTNTFLLDYHDRRARRMYNDHPHNELATQLHDGGVLGTVAIAWVLLTVLSAHPSPVFLVTLLVYSLWLVGAWTALPIGAVAWALLGMAVVH